MNDCEQLGSYLQAVLLRDNAAGDHPQRSGIARGGAGGESSAEPQPPAKHGQRHEEDADLTNHKPTRQPARQPPWLTLVGD